jgi:hypothetical protein
MPLDPTFYIDFLKPKYRKKRFGTTIPRECILEHYERLLRVVQRYFTCEVIFDRLYIYHIRLLIHFTRKNEEPLEFTFLLVQKFRKNGRPA